MSEKANKGSLATRVLRALWRLFAIGFGVVAVLLALAIGLFRVLVPMVPDYHQRIEEAASAALGYPVTFERIDARWRLRGPELVFEGAAVYHSDTGDVLVNAYDGFVNLDVGALLSRRQIVPDSILLRGVNVELVRSADGHFEMFGQQRAGDDVRTATRLDGWPLPDGRFELRDARLRYIDGDAEPIDVPELDLNLEIQGTRLRLDGNVTPPESMGGVIEVSAELDGSPGDLESAEWQVYAAGSDLDLAAFARILNKSSPHLTSGRGDAVLWAGFVGSRPRNASLEVDIADLDVNHGAELAPYDRLRGRFEWDATDAGWRAVTHGLYVARSGRIWPHVDARVEYEEAVDEAASLRLQAPFIRIEDLQPILLRLPGSATIDLARSLNAHGELHDLDLSAQLDGGVPAAYTVDVRLQQIGWDDLGKIPGVHGLSGTLRADQLGGRLEIDSQQVSFHAPSLLRSDLDAWRLAGAVVWREDQGGWQVVSDRVLLGTADFDALGRFTAHASPDAEGLEVDLSVELGDADLARIRAYLPEPVMKPRLVAWLDMALQGGTMTSASLELQGPLHRFPFDEGEGSFMARLEIEDAALGYAFGWPVSQGLDAVVTFNGRSCDARVLAGKFGAMEVESGQVSITDLKAPVLEIETRSRSQLEDIAEFFLATPAASGYSDMLAAMRPSGPANAEFRMTMPLRDWRSFDYRLDLELEGATLGYADWRFELEALTGKVALTPGRINSDGLAALLLGRPTELLLHTEQGELAASNGSVPITTVVADARGRADANVLAERLFAPLSKALSGDTEWAAQVRFPPFGFGDSIPVEVSWDADMAGMAVTLPEPLGKTARDLRPLSARLSFPGGDRFSARLTYGDDIQALLELQRTAAQWGLRRGDLALGGGSPALSERPGLSVAGELSSFDLGAWLARSTGDSPGLASVLRTADVKVGELRILSQSLADAQVKIDRNVREWLIEIESELADGAVFYPFDASDGTPVIVNMQKLHWKSADGGSATDPRTLPAMRIDVQDFAFNSWHFGSLTMALDPVEDGIALERFRTIDESFTGSASGVWRHAGAIPSEFRLQLDSTDVQSTAVRLNSVEAIDADEASLEIAVAWDNELDENIVREAYGTVAIRIGEGKLVNVDPKAGRVFGLMSITALPRRLSLDFTDIFGKGFAFDGIEGDFTIRDGSAFTENLTLRGPAAQVGIVGRAGIADRDYDQTAVVYASFGSSLPIAGAIAGGPAVGAALLIFSEVFKDPLKQIGRVDYRITGSWDNPDIARIAASGTPREPAAAEESQEPLPRGEDTSPSG